MTGFDAARRAILHDRLDNLIDQAQRLQEVAPSNASGGGEGSVRNALLGDELQLLHGFLALAREIVGEARVSAALDRPARSPEQQREQLKHWLWAIYPLVRRDWFGPDYNTLSPFSVMDALSALDAGEVQPIFQARTGKNRRANRWTLARRKLQALVWKKRLCALGQHEKQANHEITVAFGEQWDTIRKWVKQCEQILGDAHLKAALDSAGGRRDPYLHGTRGLLGSRPPRDWREGLARDGALYRGELEKAAALSDKKKGIAAADA